MTNFKYQTNIKCNGCKAKVKPQLDAIEGVCDWTVDLDSSDKILKVTAPKELEGKIIEAVKEAGFEINALNH
ncbi:heavy-metal-associated domain-containing protein [Robiginitalea sp. IMCC44478]|uniref:heavy-metal-associated domain-containing protein n=1 Tax=Robiginitalea sp. IMCC44478 TaxID=3459122 RepID=UPI0040435913